VNLRPLLDIRIQLWDHFIILNLCFVAGVDWILRIGGDVGDADRKVLATVGAFHHQHPAKFLLDLLRALRLLASPPNQDG
jgi:hypothetical protein